jgi:hypothetical protein
MKTTTKAISGAAYCGLQADLAAREGAVSAVLAHLFFQCAVIDGARTVEEWDALVVAARSAEVTVTEALEFGEA